MLANYLDKILEVYPMEINPPQRILTEQKRCIEQLYRNEDWSELILYLLQFKRFPFRHGYIPALRKRPKLLHDNPKVAEGITKRLMAQGVLEIIKGLERPKENNTQMGQKFKDYINNKFPVLDEEKFLRCSEQRVVLLEGGDNQYMDFANNHLGTQFKKGKDGIFKYYGIYVIVEAKWIGDLGGNQTNQIKDAFKTIEQTKNSQAIGLAVLDGIMWTYLPLLKRLKKEEKHFTSALFLEESIKILTTEYK